MTFPSIHPALGRALAARDYSVPTAVQLAVLEANTLERDLLVSAQTGSGKTVAFGLALATTLLGTAERFEATAEPLALIVAPTRELALQVERELAWLYAETGARVIACVGGMDARAEGRQLERGAHIVVGTPGRLRDHLERKRLVLSGLKAVVLDEADEMLDLGFREDLEFILDATPRERRTLLFSATLPRPIEALATSYQRDARRIETVRQNEPHADIEYRAVRVGPGEIENAVVNVLRLHEMRATLVFCATREAVKRMHARLLERGFSAVALSGELTQSERTQALQALRDGRARVLVATDVAARGLDLPDLALVIHADLPNDRDTLLHRSGRTGRAGRKGLCTLIVPFNRRRKAEALLGAARVNVTWEAAPTVEAIRARDQERFLADPIFMEPASEADLALARTLQEARTADAIALALVRMHAARLPAPEDLAPDRGPPRRERDPAPDRAHGREPRPHPFLERSERRAAVAAQTDARPDAIKTATPASSEVPAPRPSRPHRSDTRTMVWFRLNIGRDRNADPRWLLPLICKAGGVTKSEIGAIKIFDRETRFEIVAEHADQFADSARRAKTKEGHISRVGAHAPSDDEAMMAAINALVPPKPQPARDRAPRSAQPAEPAKLKPSAEPAKLKPSAEPAKLKPSADPGTQDRPRPSWRDRKTPKVDAMAPRDNTKPQNGQHRPGHRVPRPSELRVARSPDPAIPSAPAPQRSSWQDRTPPKGDRRHVGKEGAASPGAPRPPFKGPRPAGSGTSKSTAKYAHKKKRRPVAEAAR